MEASRNHDTLDFTRSLIEDNSVVSPIQSERQIVGEERQEQPPVKQEEQQGNTLPSDLMLSSSFIAKNK